MELPRTPAELLRRAATAAAGLVRPEMARTLAVLARTVDVVWDDQVATARIGRRGSRIEIAFGRRFVARDLRSDGELLFVLWHEISHHLQGDLRPSAGPHDERERFLRNLAADLLINRELVTRRLPEPGHAFLARYYRRSTWPVALLLPPAALIGRRRAAARATSGVALDRRLAALADAFELRGAGVREAALGAAIHVAVWAGRITRATLLRRLDEAIEAKDWEDARWLGEHERPEHDGALRDAIGRAADGDAAGLALTVTPDAAGRRWGRRLLHEIAAALDPRGERHSRRAAVLGATGVVPRLDRRRALWLSAGVAPVLWSAPLRDDGPEDGRLHVYVDTSPSIMRAMPFIVALCGELAELTGPTVFAFDADVRPVALADFARGRLHSRPATDFDPVFEHLAAARTRRALLITDGMGPCTFDAPRARTAGLEAIYLLLAPRGGHPCPLLAHLVRREWQLPAELYA